MIIIYKSKKKCILMCIYVIILWGYVCVCVYTHPKSVKAGPSLSF